jgi:hypothetical protein
LESRSSGRSPSGTPFAGIEHKRPMPEYPRSYRTKRRFFVEWQIGDDKCTGFTRDVSPTGMFIESAHIPESGLTVSLTLLLPDGRKLRVRGTVVRAHHVSADVSRFIAGGFGVRLVEAPEEYFQILARLFDLHLGKKASKLAR